MVEWLIEKTYSLVALDAVCNFLEIVVILYIDVAECSNLVSRFETGGLCRAIWYDGVDFRKRAEKNWWYDRICDGFRPTSVCLV
jgi:hypothetical protein